MKIFVFLYESFYPKNKNKLFVSCAGHNFYGLVISMYVIIVHKICLNSVLNIQRSFSCCLAFKVGRCCQEFAVKYKYILILITLEIKFFLDILTGFNIHI